MERWLKAYAGATRARFFEYSPQRPEDWRPQAAAVVLPLMRMARVNVLLVGGDEGIERVLETLRPDFQEPIATWCPVQRLALPPVGGAGTLILHDVGALAHDDQRYLLEWLEWSGGRTQVVTTTPAPLLPRIQAGTFIDTLYYRLNTIFLDVTARPNGPWDC